MSRDGIQKAIWGVLLSAALVAGGCIGDTGGNDNAGRCGNGVKEAGEQCDDGNRIDHDGCSSECVREGFCGNGVKEPGEECDDGNFTPGDGCDPECNVEVGCGNGVLDVGEECDDDNLIDLDGCSGLCTDEDPGTVCGNGVLELGEGCDDSNNDPGDGCSADCKREDGCGDGTLDASELCDDGNNVSGDGCSADCVVEFVCGNNACEEQNYETCEACPSDCCPQCGDGVLDDGEECDDGNNDSGDGCSRGCADEVPGAVCGNGIWEVGEACEDGNTTIHDGCSDTCEVEFVCGDQICEKDMGETCQRCQPDCCPSCQNGVLEPVLGEWCDGTELGGVTCADVGFAGGQLACSAWCAFDTSGCTGSGPVCGNNTAEYGEACDGSDRRGQDCMAVGWTAGTLACTSTCGLDTSGCTGKRWYFHEDFEDFGRVIAGWTFAGGWDWGSPSSGPGACVDGSRCVGTNMEGDYASNQDYATTTLDSPAIDLAGATQPVLSLFNWLRTETASDDGGNVSVSTDGGTTWTLLTPTGGYDGTVDGQGAFYGDKSGDGWHRKLFDLSSFAGQTIRLRFAFHSDSYTTYPGWYLDALYITEAADVPTQILTPEVLGVAVTDVGMTRDLAADGGSGTFDWTIEAGGTNDGWLTIDPVTGTLSGTPLAANQGAVVVNVRATVSGVPNNYDERAFQIEVVMPATIPYTETFDANPSTWTFGTGEWGWGTPSGGGPPACHSGSCIGTAMAGDYSNSLSWDTCTVTSPPINLAGTTSPTLTFYGWVETEGSSYDGGNVKVSTDGVSFTTVTAVTPAYNLTSVGGQPAWGEDYGSFQAQWYQFSVDLSAFAGQGIWIRFAFRSDGSVTYPGWYVDDVSITD